MTSDLLRAPVRSEQGDIVSSLGTEPAERRIARLRAALETDVADAALAAGAAIALDDAVAEARRVSVAFGSGAGPGAYARRQ